VSGDVTLLVIAKSPAPGRVKTRLSPPCTPEEAAGLARAALLDTLDAVARTRARRHMLVLDGPVTFPVPGPFDVVPQSRGDLGDRLRHAFAIADGPSFLVGMDTPQLTPELLRSSMEHLDRRTADAVLGPARDGGWWGLGLTRAHPGAFEGVPMSTDHTCADQRRRLVALGLDVAPLPVLRDVDHFDDALDVAAALGTSRFAGAVRRVRARVSVGSVA
jgi:rSAM/selenodomain-associated transferase 1